MFLTRIHFPQSGNTLLHRACHYGYVDVIRCLLSQGADPTIENDDDETPLDLCQDNDDIVKIFAEYNPKQGDWYNNNYTTSLDTLHLFLLHFFQFWRMFLSGILKALMKDRSLRSHNME